MKYRIYTEDRNRKDIERIVGLMFPEFTIIPATGYWHGEREKSIIIEIVGTNIDSAIRGLAQSIKVHNHQEAVLVERYQTESTLV